MASDKAAERENMLPDEALLILTVKINSCHPGPQIDKCCQHIGQGNHKDGAKPHTELVLSAKICHTLFFFLKNEHLNRTSIYTLPVMKCDILGSK